MSAIQPVYVPSSSKLGHSNRLDSGTIKAPLHPTNTFTNGKGHVHPTDSMSTAISFDFDSINVHQNYVDNTDDENDNPEATSTTQNGTSTTTAAAATKQREMISELRKEVLKLTVQRNHAKEQSESLEKKVAFWEDKCYSLQASAMLNGGAVGGGPSSNIASPGAGGSMSGSGAALMMGLSPNHMNNNNNNTQSFGHGISGEVGEVGAGASNSTGLNNASTRVTSGSTHPSFVSGEGGPPANHNGRIITMDYNANSVRSYSYFGASTDHPGGQSTLFKGTNEGGGGGDASNTRRPSEIDGNNKSAFNAAPLVGGRPSGTNSPTAVASASANFPSTPTPSSVAPSPSRKRDSAAIFITTPPQDGTGSASLGGTQSSVAVADALQQPTGHNPKSAQLGYSSAGLAASINPHANGTHTPNSIADSSNATMSNYNNNASMLRGGAVGGVGWGAASPLGHTQQLLAAAFGSGAPPSSSMSEEKRIIRALKIKLKNASNDITNYQKEIESLNKQMKELRESIVEGRSAAAKEEDTNKTASTVAGGGGSAGVSPRERSPQQNLPTTNSATLVGGLGSLVREMEKDSQLRHLIATYKAESERLRERVAELEARQNMMVPYPGWLLTEDEMNDLMNTSPPRPLASAVSAGGVGADTLTEAKDYRPTFILGSSGPSTPMANDLKVGGLRSKSGSRQQSPQTLSLTPPPPPLTQFVAAQSAPNAHSKPPTPRSSVTAMYAANPNYQRSSSNNRRNPSPARNTATVANPALIRAVVNPFTDTPKRAPPPPGRQSPAYRSQLLPSTNTSANHSTNISRTASPFGGGPGGQQNRSRSGSITGGGHATANTTMSHTVVPTQHSKSSRPKIGSAPPSSTRGQQQAAVPPQHISGGAALADGQFGRTASSRGRAQAPAAARTQSPLSTPRSNASAAGGRQSSAQKGSTQQRPGSANRMPSPIARPRSADTSAVTSGGPHQRVGSSASKSLPAPPASTSNFQRGHSSASGNNGSTTIPPAVAATAVAARPSKVTAIRDNNSEAFTTPSGVTTTYHPTRMVRHHEWEQPEERM